MDRDDERDRRGPSRALPEGVDCALPQTRDPATEQRNRLLRVRGENNDWQDLKSLLLRLPLRSPTQESDQREMEVARHFVGALHEKALKARFAGRGWDALSVDEKASVFSQVEEATAFIEGRDRAPVHAAWFNVSAGYSWKENVIVLNEPLLDSEPQWTSVWAFMHEQAHAFQRAASRSPGQYPELSPHTILKWQDNISNYIEPPDEPIRVRDYIQYAKYWLQPLEWDARLRQTLRLKHYEQELSSMS